MRSLPFPPRVCLLALSSLALLASTTAAQTGRIHGRIRDAETLRPIKGVTVVAANPQSSPSSFTSISDDRGRFSMLGLRTGTWQVRISAPGYESVSGSLRVQTLTMAAAVELTLVKVPMPLAGPFDGMDIAQLQRDLTRAALLLDEGKSDEAIVAYNAILERVPLLSVARLQLGRAHLKRKDFRAALDAFASVGKDDPGYGLAQVEVARAELERGDTGAAERVLTTAVAEPGASAEAFYMLGEMALSKGRSDEAETWLRKASETDPLWAQPLIALGRVAADRGDATAAVRYLEEALQVENDGTAAAEARTLLQQVRTP